MRRAACPPVADGVLLLGVQLGHRPAEAPDEEDGVVAEAVRSGGREGCAALARSVHDLLGAVRPREHEDDAVAAGALLSCGTSASSSSSSCVRPASSRPSPPYRAERTPGRPAERVDLNAGVVRERRQATGGAERPGLEPSVLLERPAVSSTSSSMPASVGVSSVTSNSPRIRRNSVTLWALFVAMSRVSRAMSGFYTRLGTHRDGQSAPRFVASLSDLVSRRSTRGGGFGGNSGPFRSIALNSPLKSGLAMSRRGSKAAHLAVHSGPLGVQYGSFRSILRFAAERSRGGGAGY